MITFLLWYLGCGLLTTMIVKATSSKSSWKGFGEGAYFFLILLCILVWPAILLFMIHVEILNLVPCLRKDKAIEEKTNVVD